MEVCNPHPVTVRQMVDMECSHHKGDIIFIFESSYLLEYLTHLCPPQHMTLIDWLL